MAEWNIEDYFLTDLPGLPFLFGDFEMQQAGMGNPVAEASSLSSPAFHPLPLHPNINPNANMLHASLQNMHPNPNNMVLTSQSSSDGSSPEMMMHPPHHRELQERMLELAEAFPYADDDVLAADLHRLDENLFLGTEGSGSYKISNHENSPAFKTTMSIDLFKLAMGPRTAMAPSLSRPAFSPQDGSKVLCGTEEQDPHRKHMNRLLFAYLPNSSDAPHVFTYPIPDHVRDIQWVDSQHALVAVNQKLALVSIGAEFTQHHVSFVLFPEFHKDTIREIAVSPNNRNHVISGGFDGNVFVTDIGRLCDDIQHNQRKSENSLYPVREVVGSVQWHPSDAFLGSCTTDTGVVHIFDVRTDKRRPAILYDTSKKELYTHCYKDSNMMFLGFGDGQIQIFDLRNKKILTSWEDPYQKQIGEIKFNFATKHFVTFGYPEFTLWKYDESSVSLANHGSLVRDSGISVLGAYKTSGEFRPHHTPQLAVTDSYGTFTLVEYTSNS